MSAMCLVKRIVGALVGCMVLASAGAVGAGAEGLSPWWGLSFSERPANLHGGVALNDIQRVAVNATGGSIVVFGNGQLAAFAYNASSAEAQGALEVVYGAGNVVVSGGPAGNPPVVLETEPWTIEFTGQLGDQRVGLLDENPKTHEGQIELASELFGELKGSVSDVRVRPGRPDGELVVTAENLGDAPAEGSVVPIRIEDTLPAGLRAVGATGLLGNAFAERSAVCSPNPSAESPVQCTLESSIPPYETFEVRIPVDVSDEHAAAEGVDRMGVSGGGSVGERVAERPLAMGGPLRFGVSENTFAPEREGGGVDTQAGSHPFQVTSVVTFNQTESSIVEALGESKEHRYAVRAVGLPKDVEVQTPPGLVGNPSVIPQCANVQFDATNETTGTGCANNTVIGMASTTIYEPESLGVETSIFPVYNLVPAHGEPARFGFYVVNQAVILDASVRTGGDYGVTVSSHNISEIPGLLTSRVTLWGTPGSSAHDGDRGFGCVFKGGRPCPPSTEAGPPPFLTMPSACDGPLRASVQVASWEAPAEALSSGLSEALPGLDGCNRLPFEPSIGVAPDSHNASTSSGLSADVHVPQTAALNAEGIAESSVKDIRVTLPEGVQLNPSGGDGLSSCSEGEIGYLPPPASSPPGELHFTATLGEPFCPDASKIGRVHIKSPLLPNELTGAVYLAAQNANPFGSLVAMYIVAQDPVSGTLVKLPGQVHLSETGQIETTFENSPQLPFEDAVLEFFGGERAPLATPAHCGSYATQASFVPWSAEPSDEAALTVHATSTFEVTAGPNGGPCPGSSLPFAPSLTAGTTNINAASFSPLTTTIAREDGQQSMQSVQLRFPPGVSGLLTGVKLCPEAQANEGTCSAESQIGETTVSAGIGNDPVSVKGGRVYITEKYGGAPFGLSIVNPVKAGPFDLEHDTSNPSQSPGCDCVVVRARVEVDPVTAALTVTTDASGPHAIPHLIDGIPVQIRKVNVLINRPGFAFNPTNCDPAGITGSIQSDEGASSPVSVPFQVANCANLAFKPQFSVSTTAKTSRLNGASLHVKLAYPTAAFGSQANIKSVKVELPKQLPSRLTTLQKACTATQFKANPGGCPPASVVGYAKAITPLVPVPLEGPAYFVSNGGEAFPNLIVVLQGYGVRIDLVGDTFISKAGITSSTFKTVPDAPVGSFELTLPEGPYSALAALGSLCNTKGLAMPTEFTAQNGAQLKQSTKIAVTGCAKTKKTKKQKTKHKAKKTKKRKARREKKKR